MVEPDKYKELALSKGMVDAMMITPDDIVFDLRVTLKCAWGCDRSSATSLRCDTRNITLQERIEAFKRYTSILLVHSHDATFLSRTLLELERTAFLDGYYLALAVRACNYCEECRAIKGETCSFPEKVRPCETLFGIDMFKTVRTLGLPCDVLQNKDDIQNRYGFLLID
jgi:predicted metal-binding protein